jgi:hypothetical protein
MGRISPGFLGASRGRRRQAWRGLYVWILLVLVAAGHSSAAGKATGFNVVPGVQPFPPDEDSGAMALHTLGICLDAYGHQSPYYRIVALSGSAFKFVYDTTEAYEPLRDLYPVDVLTTAATAAGLPDAHWLLDTPMAKVKEAVRVEIDKGHPLIAPFLKKDAYHGFVAIVGYDFDAGVFFVQGALRDTGYARVPIPNQWSGPTAGPLGWATNPIFVLGDFDAKTPPDQGQDKALLVTGAAMLRGGKLSYGLHGGESQYMSGGARQATFGLPAYHLLSLDVEKAPIVVTGAGQDSVDFGLLWRLDSQLGQLEHDRRYAAMALGYIVPRVSSGKSVDANELVTNVERTGADVRALRKVFWNTVPYAMNTVESLVSYVDSSTSVVFSIAGRDVLLEDLRNRGYQAFKTRWGPIVVADSHEKRLGAKMLVKSLESRERASLRLMEDLVNYIGADLGVPPQEPTGPGRRRNK